MIEFVILQPKEVMGKPTTRVSFYANDTIMLAIINIEGQQLTLAELKTIYDVAKQANRNQYGRVEVRPVDTLEDLNRQTLAVMPLGRPVSRDDMQRLVRQMVPANRTYFPRWNSTITDPAVQGALLVRQSLL